MTRMQDRLLNIEGAIDNGESKERTETADVGNLVRRAKRGDMGAFEILVKQHQTRVMSAAFRILGNSEDALDVSQEVFIKLYRFLHQFKRLVHYVRISGTGQYGY